MEELEESFIKYNEASELRELGFNSMCFGCFTYRVPELRWKLTSRISNNDTMGIVAAPIYSQVFKWFRDKYGYDVSIKKFTPSEYQFVIEQLSDNDNNYYFIDFPFESYEKAQETCLKKIIKIIKND